MRATLRTALAFAALAATTTAVRAGGPNINCIGGQRYIERWAQPIPVNGIPWYLALDGAQDQFRSAPGYPGSTCGGGYVVGQASIVAAITSWNSVGGAGGPTNPMIRPFKMASTPAGYRTFDTRQNPASLLVLDGQNTFTMLESPATFALFGASGAIGISVASLDPQGLLLDVDVALNTRGVTGGVANFGFVELMQTGADLYTTSLWGGAGSYPHPTVEYVDLQGVFTKFIGHVAGLANSLVESEHTTAGSRRVPTMFAYPQETQFGSGVNVRTTPNGFCALSNPIGVGGRWQYALDARTLEADDQSALYAAYPVTNFPSQRGSIQGTLTVLEDTCVPRNAAHIVAFRTDQPAVRRVGTLSEPDGTYLLKGLEPGDWYVLAEPIDRADPATYNPINDTTYFVDPVLPAQGQVAGTCGAAVERWTPKLSRGGLPPCSLLNACQSPMIGQLVTVTAAQTVTGIDFLAMDDGTQCHAFETKVRAIPLTARFTGQTGRTGFHGLFAFQATGVTLTVDVHEGYAGKPVELWFSEQLVTSLVDSQVVVVGGATLTKITGLTLDGNGRRSYATTPGALPAPLNTTRKPLFVQAVVFDGPFRFVTNPLVVWTLD